MSRISVAGYLFTRLKQLGITSVHGVPGDFTLKALDHVKSSGLKWIGNCNELNAGYAADGYARVKGISALFTTYGVGEMSAFNAVAGSFAEYSSVIHIVGTPARRIQNAKLKVHHSLGDGNLKVFANMYKNVTAAQADLIDPETAPELIDSALKRAIISKRPVYLELPSDIVAESVPAGNLDLPLNVTEKTGDGKWLAKEIALKIASAQRPLILVDGLCTPLGYKEEVNELVRISEIPTMCFPFGKSVVDESHENFYGVHAGEYGRVDNSAHIRSADLILIFGPLLSDNNTIGFTTIPDDRGEGRRNVNVKSLLQRITSLVKASGQSFKDKSNSLRSCNDWVVGLEPRINKSAKIDQDTFYVRLSTFLRPNDIILLANSTSLPGGRDLVLPPDTQIIQSSIFLSVGHMLPAAQGAALAQREMSALTGKKGRTILLEGDGSFQASAQELSTIIRYRLNVTIFLINNSGYTYERHIHGFDEEYNDIAPWRYLEAPSFFGAPTDGSYKVATHQVRTWGELMDVLESKDFQDGEGLKMVEVVMARGDVPGKLKTVLQNAGKALDEKPERRYAQGTQPKEGNSQVEQRNAKQPKEERLRREQPNEEQLKGEDDNRKYKSRGTWSKFF